MESKTDSLETAYQIDSLLNGYVELSLQIPPGLVKSKTSLCLYAFFSLEYIPVRILQEDIHFFRNNLKYGLTSTCKYVIGYTICLPSKQVQLVFNEIGQGKSLRRAILLSLQFVSICLQTKQNQRNKPSQKIKLSTGHAL